jgi:neutral ceramidase
MKAGFAQSVITPPLPIQLAGHRGPRMATSIGDDLYAKAMVCSDRDTLYAIVSVDLIWLPRRFVRKVRNLISRSSAIRPENVMIACTHTHSGPDTLNWYAFAPPIPGWWMEWLAQMVASTVYLALNDVDDCTVVRGQAKFDLAVNRRRPVDGQIYRLPYEMGHTDQRLSILRFSVGDRSVGGIVHAAMHPVVLGADSHAISGDWCGIAMSELGVRTGGIWLFLNGAAGDNNPKVWSGQNDYSAMCSVARAAADCAGQALNSAHPFAIDTMEARIHVEAYEERAHPYLTVEQQLRNHEEGGLYIESQVLRLGNLHFVAMGGECLFDTARLIESAVGDCLVVSYANDYVGYLPTRDHYREGGYEPAASMLSEHGADAYVSAAIANAGHLLGRNKISI